MKTVHPFSYQRQDNTLLPKPTKVPHCKDISLGLDNTPEAERQSTRGEKER